MTKKKQLVRFYTLFIPDEPCITDVLKRNTQSILSRTYLGFSEWARTGGGGGIQLFVFPEIGSPNWCLVLKGGAGAPHLLRFCLPGLLTRENLALTKPSGEMARQPSCPPPPGIPAQATALVQGAIGQNWHLEEMPLEFLFPSDVVCLRNIGGP